VNYLNDVTAVLLMAAVVTFMIVCAVLALARKEAREAERPLLQVDLASSIERRAS
jgi:hypothetical protein